MAQAVRAPTTQRCVPSGETGPPHGPHMRTRNVPLMHHAHACRAAGWKPLVSQGWKCTPGQWTWEPGMHARLGRTCATSHSAAWSDAYRAAACTSLSSIACSASGPALQPCGCASCGGRNDDHSPGRQDRGQKVTSAAASRCASTRWRCSRPRSSSACAKDGGWGGGGGLENQLGCAPGREQDIRDHRPRCGCCALSTKQWHLQCSRHTYSSLARPVIRLRHPGV